jgi:hypothetical protein
VIVLVARDSSTPAGAHPPGPSFAIDLDTEQAGVQATRSVPIGTTFSTTVVLDTLGLPEYVGAGIGLYWDDQKLTAPLANVPADWTNAPEAGPIGGRILPLVDPECLPVPGANAIQFEDGIGTAWLTIQCHSTTSPIPTSTTYLGPLVEFVFRCDASGTAAITLDPNDYTFVLDEDFDQYFDHFHNASVTCSPGGGDADSDGMPDVYESQHVCLNVNVADGSGDPDDDTMTSLVEYEGGTLPCDVDTDNDGCADGEEAATHPPLAGGQRDPLNGFDFYDVNGTKKVDGSDINLVRTNFNGPGPTPLAHTIYDRSSGAAPWAPGPPDNKINAVDISRVRNSFNHSCQAEPN